MWRNFPMIRSERWVKDNMVLLGDAKATAHFSIGSGTKLATALAEQPVSFEVDRIRDDTHTGWSVLVSGRASVVRDAAVLAAVAALDLVTWAPGERDEIVQITTDLVSGRELGSSAAGATSCRLPAV